MYTKKFSIIVKDKDIGNRLDIVISSYISDISRTYAATLIHEDKIEVNGAVKKPSYHINKLDIIKGYIPEPKKIENLEAQPIKFDILYEDKYLLVINKPPGLVVHPSPGHSSNTLVNGILYHCPDIEGGISGDLRTGIVHRLDKDTSGSIVISKNSFIHRELSDQFKSRSIKKIYLAVCYGKMEKMLGTISFSIGRHPQDRKKMSIISKKSRSAETSWKVLENFSDASLLELQLKTGRTHQIRVHLSAIGHPIIGDDVYGKLKKNLSSEIIKLISRQMLHAFKLGFTHPVTKQFLLFESKIPSDMQQFIEKLRVTS